MGKLGEKEGAAGPMGPKGRAGGRLGLPRPKRGGAQGAWAGQGAAGPAKGPMARERGKGEEGERKKEKEKRKRLSPFRNPIFLDECTYISKQSKNAWFGMVHQTT